MKLGIGWHPSCIGKQTYDGTLLYSKEVKGQRKFLYHFCKYVFTCVNIILGGT